MALENNVYNALFHFEVVRRQRNLAAAGNSFFKPYNSLSDVQQQLRTAGVSPLLGASALCSALVNLTSGCGILLVDVCTLDLGNLAEDGEKLLVVAAANLSVVIVALAVTVAATLSLVTRLFGTLLPLEELFEDIPDFRPDTPDICKR